MKSDKGDEHPKNIVPNKIKYKWVADYISEQIETGNLDINDKIPSLKQLIKKLKISKETAIKGLNVLTEKGIIESVYRKGYYVRKKNTERTFRICMILDKMHILRDRMYNAFLEKIKSHADVDVFFHHHNAKVLDKLISENLGNYTHYVLTTFLPEDISQIINRIPEQKRIILDYDEKGLEGEYTCLYQDYEADIYEGLIQLQKNLKKYKQIIVVAAPQAIQSELIISGVKRFSYEYKIPYSSIECISPDNFKKDRLYITFNRYDLDDILIIKESRKRNWQLGKEIGLLSYNDTAIKEVLENGITVLSVDFAKMGEEAAQSILENEIIRKREKAQITLRNSI